MAPVAAKKAPYTELSFGLNFLVRARGEANHTSRDFARYHVFSSDGDE
ncbi:MAG: hypothetical protein HY803_06100 [candidate division NC10 bacterium]|nr:hypothetical protein [candidate division NC10 bacterium]